MMQVRPLHFFREAQVGGVDTFFSDPQVIEQNPEATPAYGSGSYYTPGGFFLIARTKSNKWIVMHTRKLVDEYPWIHLKFTSQGLHRTSFTRRSDLLGALESVIGETSE